VPAPMRSPTGSTPAGCATATARTDAKASDQAHRQAGDALQAMEARWSADATARRSASGGVTVKTAEVLARHSLPLSGRYPRMMWLVGRGL
jgi:hypothetical protein